MQIQVVLLSGVPRLRRHCGCSYLQTTQAPRLARSYMTPVCVWPNYFKNVLFSGLLSGPKNQMMHGPDLLVSVCRLLILVGLPLQTVKLFFILEHCKSLDITGFFFCRCCHGLMTSDKSIEIASLKCTDKTILTTCLSRALSICCGETEHYTLDAVHHEYYQQQLPENRIELTPLATDWKHTVLYDLYNNNNNNKQICRRRSYWLCT